jgi:putative oxidoreductase
MVGLGLLVLRLALAVIFVAHGGNKLFGLFGGPGIGPGGLSSTSAFFAFVGLNPPFVLAVIDALLELVGGLLLGVGFLTRWISIALAISMGVAIWKVHAQWGFFLNWMGAPDRGQGMEFAIVLIAALACLALSGGGDASVDGINQRSAARDAAGRARLRGKI